MKKIIALVSIVLLAVACIKDKPTPNNPIPTNVDGEKLTNVTWKYVDELDTVNFFYENNKLVKFYSSKYLIPTSSSLGGINRDKINILINWNLKRNTI